MINDMLNYIKMCTKASILTIIIPILFVLLLFIGCKFFGKGEWNDEFLSLKQTQAIRGFCVIGILFHHLSQKTAASWLESRYIIHGLDFFVDIGYLFVAVFIFVSGYGLYKSYKNKDNYFKGYFSRRLLPLVLAYIITSLIYYLYKGIESTYTWYVIAIAYCYILFYLTFKNIKNEYLSLSLVLFGIVLYCSFCKFMIFGGWWYNVIGLFIIGLVFAKFEKNIIGFIKKIYVPLLIISVVLMFVFRYYGCHYETVIYNVTKESTYDLYSLLIILYRFFAGVFFTLTIILISLKCEFNNKILSFYDSISLEFYLIQGLFVQIFSYSYFDTNEAICYIKNVLLYTIVVFVLSTVSAFIIKFIIKKIIQFWNYFKEREEYEIAYVAKSVKKLLTIIAIVFITYLTINFIADKISISKTKKEADEYINNNITYVDVYGKKMSAYIVGSGKNTLVFMRGNDDPCPTITQKYLADNLSSDFRVVVLDYLGTGFSDKPTTNRTCKNIVNEIHEALHRLGINSDYILVPEYISGLYAQEYVKKYKDEVKAVVAIETSLLSEYTDIANINGLSLMERVKSEKRDSIIMSALARVVDFTSIDTFLWENMKYMYMKGFKDEDLKLVKYMTFKNLYNSEYVNEKKYQYDNFVSASNIQYPRGIRVIDVLDSFNTADLKDMGINHEEEHTKICFDRSKHKTTHASIYQCFFEYPDTLKNILLEAFPNK